MKQSVYIEELKLNSYRIDFHYIRLILNNFHNLKKLSFSICSFLNDSRAEEIKNIRLPTVTDLELVNYSDDVAVLNAVIDIFPNIETLTMDISYYSFRGVLEKLPKLKKLVVPSGRFEMLVYARSESLRELTLSNFTPILDSFFIEKLAEDLPNLERLMIHNIDIRKLNKTLNHDIQIILKSLKLFDRLKHFELINTESGTLSPSPDADAEQPEELETYPEFRLTITTIRDQKCLTASEYFIENHAETMKKMKIDLKIVEA
jgi:hypothetical protein